MTSDRPVRLPLLAETLQPFVAVRTPTPLVGQLLQAATHRRACGEQVGLDRAALIGIFMDVHWGLGGFVWLVPPILRGDTPSEQPTERSQLARTRRRRQVG